ncbi:MAG: dTMP kinase [Legionellales bacterium RIFCSPHIGHO2_12_FULL_37_14]|nr:MAG: dTMP kinase [Legionellales bacterium RIFCSPHIGHO2_12_FULL_37_14]
MVKKGKFIVVEGLEGAGKSTVVESASAFLHQHGIRCIKTREPGGTKIGENLRHIIKSGIDNETLVARAELLLIYAARVQLLDTIIKPALESGTWVISDRFELSTFAYQGGGRQLDKSIIQEISQFCLQGFKPDQTLFLDIMPEQGLKRAKQRGEEIDKIEQESRAFFSRVYHAYHECISALPNVDIISATLPIDEVLQAVHKALAQTLNAYAIS